MRNALIFISLALAITGGSAWGGTISRDTETKLKQIDEKASAIKSGKTSEYAMDSLNEAKATISAAQAAAAVGNEKLALQKIEMATIQLTIAEAKGAERELLERVAIQRVELKKLESQLERYLQGEEK